MTSYNSQIPPVASGADGLEQDMALLMQTGSKKESQVDNNWRVPSQLDQGG